MTRIHSQSDINSIIIAWSDQGISLLRQATGLEWGCESEVDLWDAVIRFKQGKYTHSTQYYNFDESIEVNFLRFLADIIMIAHSWRRQNGQNR